MSQRVFVVVRATPSWLGRKLAAIDFVFSFRVESAAAASSPQVYRPRRAGCAWRALKLYFGAYFHDADVTPGAVGFVQTAGELLNFHPHVHVLVTDGGFLPDGAFRPLAWFDSRHVERLFRAEVLRMRLGKELITEATVDNLLSWRHSGFSAHGAVRADDRQGAVRLGRYMIRCPIVHKRLSWHTESGEVLYRGPLQDRRPRVRDSR